MAAASSSLTGHMIGKGSIHLSVQFGKWRRLRQFARNRLNTLHVKFLAALFFIIVPLITVLVISNYYAIEVVRNQVGQSNKNLLSLYRSQMDKNLDEVDNYLFSLAGQNTDLIDLQYDAMENEDKYMKAKLRLFDELAKEITYNNWIDLFFIYSEKNDDLIINQHFGTSYEERTQVKASLLDMLHGDTSIYNNRMWYIWHANDNYYLFHLIKTGNVYTGAWVNINKISIPLQLIDLGKSGVGVLATGTMEPMNNEEILKREGITLHPGTESYYLSGERTPFLVMNEASTKGDFFLIALVPESVILEKLPFLQRISSVIVAVAILFLLVFIILMRRIFLQPIQRLVQAMRTARSGNLSVQINSNVSSSKEFQIMNESFNHMMEEISKLKIDVYEEQLNHQRAELKHLQLQINPHFFLNSLNIIYNLATVKDYILIQEMAKCLVAYFRFMFRSGSGVVSLKDELIHTENYLHIQQLRFPDRLAYQVNAPDALLRTSIPPLIIQSLVENAIKHGVSLDHHMSIRIEVLSDMEAEYPCMRIMIADSGIGFSEDVLWRLRNGEVLEEEGQHIGIWNVQQRLRLIYKGQATIQFMNGSNGGAVVLMRLPLYVPSQEVM